MVKAIAKVSIISNIYKVLVFIIKYRSLVTSLTFLCFSGCKIPEVFEIPHSEKYTLPGRYISLKKCFWAKISAKVYCKMKFTFEIQLALTPS